MITDTRRDDFLAEIRDISSALTQLQARADVAQHTFEGLGFSGILNDSGFDAATFFTGDFEGLEKEAVLNFISSVCAGLKSLVDVNKTTLSQLKTSKRLLIT